MEDIEMLNFFQKIYSEDPLINLTDDLLDFNNNNNNTNTNNDNNVKKGDRIPPPLPSSSSTTAANTIYYNSINPSFHSHPLPIPNSNSSLSYSSANISSSSSSSHLSANFNPLICSNSLLTTASAKKRRVSESPNSDSILIANSTAQEMRLLNIDPDSKEGKKEQRRIRNRMSAMMHREKKKAYIETLEEEAKEKDQIIIKLQQELSRAIHENEQLKLTIHQMTNIHSIPQTAHALSHQDFLGAIAKPQPTYGNKLPIPTVSTSSSSNSNSSSSSCSLLLPTPPMMMMNTVNTLPLQHPLGLQITRTRAGTAVTSNEGSGSDTECSVSGLTDMWGSSPDGDSNTPENESDDFDDNLVRDDWRNYLSSETPLSTPSPASLTPSPPLLFSNSTTTNTTTTTNSKRSINLYSFVFLLSGLSFFSGWFAQPLSTSLYNNNNYSTPSFQFLNNILYDSNNGNNRINSEIGGPYLLSQQQQSQSSQPSTLITSNNNINHNHIGGSRVLLSLPPVEENKEINEETHANELAPIIWTPPNHVTSLYPLTASPITLNSNIKINDQDNNHNDADIENDKIKLKIKKRYLRTVNSTLFPNNNNIDHINQDKDHNNSNLSTELTHVYTTKELSMFYDNTWPSASSSMSKIFLTDGRVLLDPSIAAAGFNFNEFSTTPSQTSTSQSISSSTSKAIIPSTSTSSQSTTSSSSSSSSSQLPQSSSSATTTATTTTTATSTSSNQLLTMVVPVTTIQWGGTSWMNGNSPHNSNNVINLLMRNMNLTSFAMENDLVDEDNNIDISRLWVEIACTVLKARIVKDVVVIS